MLLPRCMNDMVSFIHRGIMYISLIESFSYECRVVLKEFDWMRCICKLFDPATITKPTEPLRSSEYSRTGPTFLNNYINTGRKRNVKTTRSARVIYVSSLALAKFCSLSRA